MAKFRFITVFYLTVAVMVSVALMPFAADSAEAVFPDEVITENISENEGCTLPEITVTEQNTEKPQVTENNAPKDYEYTEEASSEEESFSENTAVTEKEETAAEAVTEEVLSIPFVDETVAEENTTAISESETPSLYDSYLTSGAREKVFDLHFLASNYGALEAADCINTYTFTLESRAMFTFFVTHGELTGLQGWKVSLYEEYYVNGDGGEKDYRLITALTTKPSAAKERSPEIGLLAGSYRLVVTSGDVYTAERYQIDATYRDTSGYETECNDNIYRYTEVYSSVPIKGSASLFPDRQDEDYYMFRMYEDGFVELKFAHPVVKDKITVCWQVIFFSEDGTELYSVNSLFSEDVNHSGAIGLSEGNYFVLVRNRVYTDVTYTLSISRTDDRSYEKEKNDTPATANVISLNSPVVGSVSNKTTDIDKDWFSFTIEKTGCVMIEFAHQPIVDDSGKEGWNYVLTDSDGAVLFTGISLWSSDVVSSPEIGLGAGTYYVRVDSEDRYHNSSEYYLLVNFSECDDWESEYNNTFQRADMIQSDIPVNGFLSECGIDYDFDFYTFTLTEQTDISVLFSHEALSYNRNIFTFTLYDADKNAVADSEGSTVIKVAADAEKVTADYKALPAGKYYIKVGTGQFFDLIRYSLCFNKGDTI